MATSWRGLWSKLEQPHLVVGLGVATLAATGLLTDLRGFGFMAADIWTGAFGLVTHPSFQPRALAALGLYGGPLLALAVVGYVLGVRQRNPLIAFLGIWAAMLVALTGVLGTDVLSMIVLPLAPAALLGGTLLARLPLDTAAYRMTGRGWGAVAGTVAAIGIGVLVFAQTAGGGARPLPVTVLVAAPALLVLVWLRLRPRRGVSSQDREGDAPFGEAAVAAGMVAGLAFVLVTISSISRASFGASPPGSELLVTEETHPAFRATFRELTTLARAEPRRLVVDLPNPDVALWYGREISSVASGGGLRAGTFELREAPPMSSGPGRGDRRPWKVTSQVETSDLHPLGVLRWLATRTGLVQGRPHDIILEFGER
jgi:hypothetical protein